MVLLTVFMQGSIAAAQDDAQPPVRPIARFVIGWSSTDHHMRNVASVTEEGGWEQFVAEWVLPVVEWFEASGVEARIVLWNPGGAIRGEAPQFDQFVDAAEGVPGVHDPLPWLLEDFVRAWQPLTIANPVDDRVRAEVIAYIGSPTSDLAFDWQAGKHLQDDLLERTLASLRLPVDAGMSLAFDAAAHAADASQTHRLVQYLDSIGVRTYIEATPSRLRKHWYDHDIFIFEPTYQYRHADDRPLRSAELYDTADAYTGEVIRVVRPIDYDQDVNQMAAVIRRIVADGHTPCFDAGPFIENGWTLKQVLGNDE